MIFVQPDEAFDVWIGVARRGERRSSVMVIKTGVIARNDTWTAVAKGRIILAGPVEHQLQLLLNTIGRRSIDRIAKEKHPEEYPNGLFSGSRFDRLAKHLGRLDSCL